jgi:hypothetical protein
MIWGAALTTTAFAQKIAIDERKYCVYLDKDWAELPSKEGASYVRVFMGIDSIMNLLFVILQCTLMFMI